MTPFLRASYRYVLLSLLSDSVAAQAAMPIKSVVTAEPQKVVYERARGVQIKRLKIAPLVNSSVGESSTNAQCSDVKPLYLDSKLVSEISTGLTFAVTKNLREQGYARNPLEESVFAEATPKPVEIELGALVQEIQLAYCRKGDAPIEGAAYIKARWELLVPAAQKVVYTAQLEGSAPQARYASTTELFRALGDSLVRNLLADRGAVQWLSGASPLPAALPVQIKDAGVRLESIRPPPGGVDRDITLLRAAVVTIEAGSRIGSGFVISRKGYVLTNHHVVGTTRFVKLRLASGRELVGEVIQSHPQRDIALIKTEAGLEPLAIRLGDLRTGETVFAIGSPLGEKFSGSLTKGIVSAYRMRDNQRFIQSDVAILSGSSGGPLLDESGRVVGLTQSGIEAGRANINLFVPITDGLKVLGIALPEGS